METVGEFVLVVMHCMAHIKVVELTDDYNPHFLREFYKVRILHGSPCSSTSSGLEHNISVYLDVLAIIPVHSARIFI